MALVSPRARWVMRLIVFTAWAVLSGLLAWAAETVDPSKRVILMIPTGMLWMPLTMIMVLIWNPRHRLYW